MQILQLTPFGIWLAEREISYAEVARDLNISRACVQQWATGGSTPTMWLAGVITSWTLKRGGPAIDANSWIPYAKKPKRRQ